MGEDIPCVAAPEPKLARRDGEYDREDLRRLHGALNALVECHQVLVRASDEAEMLREFCQLLVDRGGYRMAWFGEARDGPERSVVPIAAAGAEDGYLDRVQVSWGDTPRGRGPIGVAIRTGGVSVCREDRRGERSSLWRDDAGRRTYASSIALPVGVEGRIIGALCIYSSLPDAFFDEEVRLLTGLAGDLSFGLELLRRRQRYLRTVAELGESRRRMRAVLAAAPVALWALDRDGRFTLAEGNVLSEFGIASGGLIGSCFWDLTADLPDLARATRRALRGKGTSAILEAGGQVHDAFISPALDDEGQVAGVIGVATDISERSRLQEEILRIGEMERRRIGRDLHDSLGQTLTGVHFLSSVLARRLEDSERTEAGIASQIAELAGKSLVQARTMARRLCPVGLEAGGLVQALQGLVDDCQRYMGKASRLDCSGPGTVDDGTIATHLFHIAQEAVNNAVRHSGASRVTLRLATEEREVALTVRDDGVGIAEDAALSAGMGLQLMRHRAAEIGGHLTIRAGEAGGTTVECRVPIGARPREER